VGWPLIAVGLRNRVVGNRNQALRALGSWPREQLSDEIKAALQEAFWKEPYEAVRGSMRALIEGTPPPD
jgi:hypothetical protein